MASGECCEAFDSEGADPISFNCPATACSTQWSATGDNDGGDYNTDNGGDLPGAGELAKARARARSMSHVRLHP
jgi:hypothetical protein